MLRSIDSFFLYFADYGLFSERTAGSLPAFTCAVSHNIHMLRMTFVIGIVHTVSCFAVDTDRSARMFQGADIRISRPFAGEAFTACVIFFLRMFSAYHDIALAAVFSFVVYATFHAAI